jgi:hypothetical protein
MLWHCLWCSKLKFRDAYTWRVFVRRVGPEDPQRMYGTHQIPSLVGRVWTWCIDVVERKKRRKEVRWSIGCGAATGW